MDQSISEICIRVKISDYLMEKGHEVIRSGRRIRCKCPLGTHRDSDPSFYITTMPDGAEVFKCFGCDKSGNIITIMHLLGKGEKKGDIVRRLAASAGVKLGKFNDGVRTEPHPHDIMALFCDEDDVSATISHIALLFMHTHKSTDAINKVSRLYEMLDELSDRGDLRGIAEVREKLYAVIREYNKTNVEPAATPKREVQRPT